MFEKEAKEYTKEKLCKECHNHCREGMCTCAECKKKTFKDGAEFGYNKANEWHKVTCFDEPDENGYITASNPAEEGKDYLILLKNKRFVISGLACDSDGYFFEDFDWEDIEAWAELPEV